MVTLDPVIVVAGFTALTTICGAFFAFAGLVATALIGVYAARLKSDVLEGQAKVHVGQEENKSAVSQVHDLVNSRMSKMEQVLADMKVQNEQLRIDKGMLQGAADERSRSDMAAMNQALGVAAGNSSPAVQDKPIMTEIVNKEAIPVDQVQQK